MVLCKTLRIGRIPTTGFVFSADKYADAKPFTTTLQISYPARSGATVSLVNAGDTLDACIQDAVLDSAGNASVQYTVSKKQTLYAMVKEGDCCTTFSYPPCLVSNYISFDVPTIGSISFSSIPGGAEIFLDGQDQGVRTPATVTDVPAGTHTYALKLANYNDYTGTVNVIEDQTIQVSATLDVMEGCIYFNTTPAGAKIFIDDVDTGQVTPALICGLSLGTHTYRLVLAGYYEAGGAIPLTPGQGATIIASPFTKIPKEGVGAGTVLGLTLLGAGVLGAVVYFTREKKPEYTLPGYKRG